MIKPGAAYKITPVESPETVLCIVHTPSEDSPMVGVQWGGRGSVIEDDDGLALGLLLFPSDAGVTVTELV